MKEEKYWIAVIPKIHANLAMSGSFIQISHGKKAPLMKMKKNDWIIIYSSKNNISDKLKCQSFTAIGQVADDDIYSFKMSEDFIPFRRNIKFYDSNEVSIIPLISELEFIQNKKSWGYPFRFGFLEIKENDFNLIKDKMIP